MKKIIYSNCFSKFGEIWLRVCFEIKKELHPFPPLGKRRAMLFEIGEFKSPLLFSREGGLGVESENLNRVQKMEKIIYSNCFSKFGGIWLRICFENKKVLHPFPPLGKRRAMLIEIAEFKSPLLFSREGGLGDEFPEVLI